MPKLKNIGNRKNITYELASGNSELTNQDKEKLFKLLKKIAEGKSISEKLKKSGYNKQKLLTTKIIYKDENKEGTLTLLCHSMFEKNNQAFETLLQEAIKQEILKDVLNEELIQKLFNGQTIIYTVLVSCILEKNSKALRTVLEASKDNGILKEILNQKVKIKKTGGQEISYTLIDYADKQDCKEIAEILKEFRESLNIEVKDDVPVSSNAEAVSTRCEDINKDSKDPKIHEPMLANSEEAQNILTEDDIDQTQSSSISTTTFTEVVKRDQTQLFSHSKSRKGSAANEEPLTEIKHKRKLIKIDRELREKLRDNLTWESKAVGTDTQSQKDINEDDKDFQLIFKNMEKAETKVPLPKEKMVSTQRLIPLDPLLLDDEYIGNFNPTMIEHAEEKAMSTQRLIPLDPLLLDDEYIGNFNPTTIEHAEEKAMSTKRLIPLDPILLDNEDNENFHLTFENSKKAQNSSIKTAVQEPNVSESPSPAEPCFDNHAADEKLSTKAMQQKQAIVAGSAGAVLLVSSVASYIMKMHIIAVVSGIVGLVCISFALYSVLKPNTKLEKVEGIEQPIIQYSLNPT